MKHVTTRQRWAWRVVAAAASTAVVAGVSAPFLVTAPAGAADRVAAPQPVDSTSQGPKQVTLAWSPVNEATGYVVQVGQDDSWSDKPTLELPTVASRLTLPVWLPHGDYVWRVAARGEGGLGRWSATSDATTFTRGWPDRPTPTSLADANGTPVFTWTPVPGASEYQLQVSDSPTFDDKSLHRTQATPIVQACFTTHTRLAPFVDQAVARNGSPGPCTITRLAEDTPMYWRVRGLDHVAEKAPEVNTTPVVDEGISHLPPVWETEKLDLTACPTPSGIKPSPSPTPEPLPGDDVSASPTPAPEELKVEPCEPANPVEKGAWSRTLPFTISTPDVPTVDYRSLAAVQTAPLPAGTCTAGVCRDFPTLSWEKVDGATSYRVYVAMDAAYTNIHQVVETPALEWTPATSWRDSSARQAYFYVVQPCTSEGCGQVTSSPPSFRKVSPPVTLTGPADEGFANGHDVVLEWEDHAATLAKVTGKPATSGPYAYRVQVTTPDNPDFQAAGLLFEAETDFTHHVAPDRRFAEGEYLWRVQAVDASANRLPWSAARGFRVDAAPFVLRTSPSVEISADGPIRIRFSEPVTGVSATTVSLSDVPIKVTQPEPSLAVVVPLIGVIPGQEHTLTVNSDVKDAAGQGLLPFSRTMKVGPAFGDSALMVSYAGTWVSSRSSEASGGVFHRATPDGRTHTAASFSIQGTGVVVDACTGPAHGVVEVWVDGVLKARADTYSIYTTCQVPVVRITGLPAALHRVELRATGTKNPASRGTMVSFDGGHLAA